MDGSVPPGTVLGRKVRIERVLGRGGMGVVYAAHHLDLDKPVAVKILAAEALNDVGRARFLQEARAAARIESEHIVRVYDVSQLDDGVPYLVMELLDGKDLDALVQERGPLRAAAAAEYGVQVCEALAAAHVAGIIHRDLKPENLFLTKRLDGRPLVKVIDFGISRVLWAPGGVSNLTRTRQAPGSPMFMSPEHLARPREVDARSDIWSLGVTLFYLLTGAYPFDAETVHQLTLIICQGEPAAPSVFRQDLPEGLEQVVMRCLEKDPAARYPDVAEVAAALVPFAPARSRDSAESSYRMLRSARGGDASPASWHSFGALSTSDPFAATEPVLLRNGQPRAEAEAQAVPSPGAMFPAPGASTTPPPESAAGGTTSQSAPILLRNVAAKDGGAADNSVVTTPMASAPAAIVVPRRAIETQDDEAGGPRSAGRSKRSPRWIWPTIFVAIVVVAWGAAMIVDPRPEGATSPSASPSATPGPSRGAVAAQGGAAENSVGLPATSTIENTSIPATNPSVVSAAGGPKPSARSSAPQPPGPPSKAPPPPLATGAPPPPAAPERPIGASSGTIVFEPEPSGGPSAPPAPTTAAKPPPPPIFPANGD